MQVSTLTITATMPDDGLEARASFSESEGDGSMSVRWKEGDKLQLYFVQKDIPYKATIPVTTISEDKKKATFKVKVPDEITSGSFDLYGVAGGTEADDTDPRRVVLYDKSIYQQNADYAFRYMEDKNIPILKFAQKDVVRAENISADVTMQHLGWLLALHIKNNTGKNLTLKPAITLHSSEQWNYNSEKNYYDLVNDKFVNASGYDCVWTPLQTPLQNGQAYTFWQWVASTDEIPDMELILHDNVVSTEPFAKSGNVLRKREIKNGNTCHFWVQFESENNFIFTRPFTDVPPADISNGGDPYFTMDDIRFWAGEGAKKAALVIEWHDGKYPDALVWGYRWDSDATGLDMLREIVKADPFLIAAVADQWGGKVIGGIGYNMNKTGDHYLIINNETDKPKYPANGMVEVTSADFDHIRYSDASDHWQSGWYDGYWSYFVKDDRLDAWEYSNFIATFRELEDGSWDGWSYLDDMNEWNGRPLGNEFAPALPD